MQSADAKLMIIDAVNEGICVAHKKILVDNMDNLFTLFNKCMLYFIGGNFFFFFFIREKYMDFTV